MTPFEQVFTYLTFTFPHLERQPGKAVAAVTTVKEWLAEGCDPELDIIAEIERIRKAKPEVTSPAYFTAAILIHKHARTNDVEEQARKADFKLNAIRWKRERGIFLTDSEERQLEGAAP